MRQALPVITPDLLLRAYEIGLFPMAEDADDPSIHWIEPELRGVIPLDGLHVPHRLARTVRGDRFHIEIDRDFEGVIAGCASTDDAKRRRTWINARIRKLYADLFAAGHCHTVEAYLGEELVGGLYGVSLGAAFFGESMFSHARDASKVALVHLVARLRRHGYRLLDTQFVTPHLASLGAVEMARPTYMRRLRDAVAQEPSPSAWRPGAGMSGAEAMAAIGQNRPRSLQG